MTRFRESQTTFAVAARLTICGRETGQAIEEFLPENLEKNLGRSSKCDIVVKWESALSRNHATVRYRNHMLHLTCLPTARNPLWIGEEKVRETIIRPGEVFRVGRTTFLFEIHTPVDDSDDIEEDTEIQSSWGFDETFTPDSLREVPFSNTSQQLKLLGRIPEIVAKSTSDTNLGHQLCRLLVEAMPHAAAVAVAHFDPDRLLESEGDAELPEPQTMRVVTRDNYSGSFRAHPKTVIQAIRDQTSVLRVGGSGSASADFSRGRWVICSPVRAESCRGWCMYVTGDERSSEKELQGDVRFTELVAQFIGSVRQVRLLQDRQSRLTSFFSPNIAENLSLTDELTSLEPAERSTTILFCDVRGFSRKVEEAQANLLPLLENVRRVLGMMVDGILEQDGTIADFQGDAAVGFWGWPVPLKYGPMPACRAALAIQAKFHKAAQSKEFSGFAVGIGICYGTAVAGQIGTDRQSKIGVFGPVVNQCARLESLTKQFGVSICIDGPTAEFVDRYLSSDEARVRPLARVRPKGMSASVDVHQLLPGPSDLPDVTDEMLQTCAAAHNAVIGGEWDVARQLLNTLPEDDGPRRFLLEQMKQLGDSPPTDWDGSFLLTRK